MDINKQQEMKDLLDKHVLSFARYTITDRAIPNLADGLKPIHKRILWSMYLDGLYYNKKRTKSVNAVGSVLRFSPHGDASVYDAMVRLTNDSVNLPLLDGKGSFSSVTTTAEAGASRYTNIRLSKITVEEIMKDINKNAVDMSKNYDETMDEPTQMPSTIPLILLNPNKGIAMGIASNICPFNMSDVFKNTINILEGKETFPIYPDFSTGGKVEEDLSVAESVKKTGRGSFKLRAKYHFVDNSIIITEIPYGTTRESIISSIIDSVKKGSLKDIVDVNDNTGVQGLEIEIECKKNTNLELLMQKLYKLTPLETHFSCNFNVLLNGKPITLGTDDILKEWIKFRKETIKRILNYDLNKKSEKLHELYGLKKLLINIDEVIRIIKESKTDKDMIHDLMKKFNLDEGQAQNISNMKLRNINKNYINDKIEQINKLENEINEIINTINNDDKINKIIIDDLKRVEKEYGTARKTEITKFETLKEEEIKEIDNYNIRVFVTKEGYLKKIPLTSLRGNFNIRVKDGDYIINEVETTNNSEILVFTDNKNVYKIRTHELEDSKPSQLGTYLPTYLELKDEEILYVTATNDHKGYLLVGFDDGKMAKIELSAYETKTNRTILKNAYADKNAIYFNHIQEDIDVIAVSSIDKVLVFNTSMINPKTSKTTIGVTVMKSKNDSFVKNYYTLDGDYEEVEYYRTAGAGVGKYLKKGDFSSLIK